MAVQENMTYQQVQTNLPNSAGKVFKGKVGLTTYAVFIKSPQGFIQRLQ